VQSAAETFPADPQSVGAARRFALRAIRQLGADALSDDVTLVVSELATNAVLHARTAFTVSLDRDGDRLRVAVSDGSAARPRIRRVSDLDSSTGRGLAMIARLSAAWGVEPAAGDGKATWCLLGLQAGGRSDVEDVHDDDDVDALLARFPDPGAESGTRGTPRACLLAAA
jgi:anti-sigma regulatory factor (Ser/Thr protein kinase)